MSATDAGKIKWPAGIPIICDGVPGMCDWYVVVGIGRRRINGIRVAYDYFGVSWLTNEEPLAILGFRELRYFYGANAAGRAALESAMQAK